MVKIIAQFNIKKDSVAKAIDLAKELVKTTRQEKGCLQYDLLQEKGAPELLIIVEAWESQEVLDIHSASEHFGRIVPQLAEMCVTPPKVANMDQLI